MNTYIQQHKPAIGQRVVANGYAGTITRVCEWSDSMVEVRLPSGVVCVDYNGVDCWAIPRCHQCGKEAKAWGESRQWVICVHHGIRTPA
jgi:hypothetical protein